MEEIDKALDAFRDTKVGRALKRILQRQTDFIRDPLGLGIMGKEERELQKGLRETAKRFGLKGAAPPPSPQGAALIESRAAPSPPPQGRVLIELRAAPGTQARVLEMEAKNLDIEVDSGLQGGGLK